jgi:hypothetical protein
MPVDAFLAASPPKFSVYVCLPSEIHRFLLDVHDDDDDDDDDHGNFDVHNEVAYNNDSNSILYFCVLTQQRQEPIIERV